MQRRAKKHRDNLADSPDCTSWQHLLQMHPKLAALLPHWPYKAANPLTMSITLPLENPLLPVVIVIEVAVQAGGTPAIL